MFLVYVLKDQIQVFEGLEGLVLCLEGSDLCLEGANMCLERSVLCLDRSDLWFEVIKDGTYLCHD